MISLPCPALAIAFLPSFVSPLPASQAACRIDAERSCVIIHLHSCRRLRSLKEGTFVILSIIAIIGRLTRLSGLFHHRKLSHTSVPVARRSTEWATDADQVIVQLITQKKRIATYSKSGDQMKEARPERGSRYPFPTTTVTFVLRDQRSWHSVSSDDFCVT